MEQMKTYITCVGWEDRFYKSFEHHLNTEPHLNTISFLVEEFRTLSESGLNHRSKLLTNFDGSDHKLITVSSRSDTKTWSATSECLSYLQPKAKVILDISTMPRQLIWTILHFLDKSQAEVNIAYCKPNEYCSNNAPLTREPLKPRLTLKHSGIFLPGRNTILIAQVGFDYDRLNQLIFSYEPEKVILATQKGSQFDNDERHRKEQTEKLSFSNLEFISVDAFNDDHAYKAIECVIGKNIKEKNIVMAALGPKIVTVTMYLLNKKYPEVGLVDVPVGEYNLNYSKGADCKKILSMKLDFFE